MEKIELKGFFAMTDYSLTHHIVLIRSTVVVNGEPRNTDVLFSGTFYIELATMLEDLMVEQGNEDDLNYVKMRSNGQAVLGKVFVIHSVGVKYYIGARQMEILENSLDVLETSIGAKKHLYHPPAR